VLETTTVAEIDPFIIMSSGLLATARQTGRREMRDTEGFYLINKPYISCMVVRLILV